MYNKLISHSLLTLLLISSAAKTYCEIIYKDKKIIIEKRNYISKPNPIDYLYVLDRKTKEEFYSGHLYKIPNMKISFAKIDDKSKTLVILDKKSKIRIFRMVINSGNYFSLPYKIKSIRSTKLMLKDLLVITDEKSNIRIFHLCDKKEIIPKKNVAIRSVKTIQNEILCIQLQNNQVYLIARPGLWVSKRFYLPNNKLILYLGDIQTSSLKLLSTEISFVKGDYHGIIRKECYHSLLSKNKYGLYFLYDLKTGKRLNDVAAKYYKCFDNKTVLMQYTGNPYKMFPNKYNAIDIFDAYKGEKLNDKPICIKKNKKILYKSIKIIHQKLLRVPYKDKTYNLFHIKSGRKLNTQAIAKYNTIDKGNMIYTISQRGKRKYYDIDTGKQPRASLFGKKNRKKIQHLLLHKLQLSLSQLSTIKFVDLSPDNKKLYIEYKNQESKLLDIKSKTFMPYNLNQIKPKALKNNYNDKQEKISLLRENLAAQDLPLDGKYNVRLEQFPIKLYGKTLLATKTLLLN